MGPSVGAREFTRSPTPLKKENLDSLSLRSHLLSLVPQLGVGEDHDPFPTPCYSVDWIDLGQVLRRLPWLL